MAFSSLYQILLNNRVNFLFLSGDFNYDLLNHKNCCKTNYLLGAMFTNHSLLTIVKPTKMQCDGQGLLLDNIFLNSEDVTFHSLLVTNCKITNTSLQNLLVTCSRNCLLQKKLVTCCRSCSLQKLLVTCCKICLLLVPEVACCKKSLVTCCRNCSLQKVTSYLLQNSFVACCRSYSLQKVTCY